MDFSDSMRPIGGWHHRLGPRVRTLWFAKMAGTTLGITAFFVAYFWVLQHPFFTVTTMPLIALDRWVAFRPEAFVLYVSLWVYVSLGPALLKDSREVISYGLATGGLSLAGLSVFVLWPTAVPDFALDWSAHPSLAFLKTVDVAGNACPSLHVAFAVFTALWLERILRETGERGTVRGVNALWCLGIVYSTLAIRQHVALDALAGAALGAAVALLHMRSLDRAVRRAGARADAVRSAGDPAAPGVTPVLPH
ncbi:phosphatase PAP2 family protein [Methylibium sp.]|uniref:phosphatase PAP2 family protein n=1 Tax=Methylibium sp. TaxID=2067992 RepID=UPI0025E90EC2|nr:phosphatase PAP2 family protein [Methylibium sp.]